MFQLSVGLDCIAVLLFLELLVLGPLLRRGSLGFFKGGWRASESNEYIGELGKRMVSARGSLGFLPLPIIPRAPYFLYISLSLDLSLDYYLFFIIYCSQYIFK